jgi:large subunit ribosomal protein L37Ae
MVKKKSKGAGRFGARYGSRLKEKFLEVESRQKKKYKCPLCLKPSVKRVSYGIWHCNKCDTKFAGKAYSLS